MLKLLITYKDKQFVHTCNTFKRIGLDQLLIDDITNVKFNVLYHDDSYKKNDFKDVILSGIYSIEIDNKHYVGLAKDIFSRWINHIYNMTCETYKRCILYEAARNVDLKSIIFQVLELTSNLQERERFWINKLNSYNVGYNDTLGGELVTTNISFRGNSNPRKILSNEERNQIRELLKKFSDEEIYENYFNDYLKSNFMRQLDEIKQYKTNEEIDFIHNQKTTNSFLKRHNLTENDVKQIRQAKVTGQQRSNVFEMFKNKMSYSVFLRIWNGKTAKTIQI